MNLNFNNNCNNNNNNNYNNILKFKIFMINPIKYLLNNYNY
ncbi:hypothetical protein [Cetobacterium sp. SF1]